ncbi:hypothetical protein IAR55_006503 [Kwoniella newhampshirensis]|uniref:Uncharacterized protein n=1 Tax=Kwoniella newhampshirensis TaxID=1651941 RepID=A0AAW0YE83_9TREE
MFGLDGLPNDEELSQLPPLPETPNHARSTDDIPEEIVPGYITRTQLQPAATDSHQSWGRGERGCDIVQPPLRHERVKSVQKANIEPTYPILSTRQSASSPAIAKTPHRNISIKISTILRNSPSSTSDQPVLLSFPDQSHSPTTRLSRRLSISFDLPKTAEEASLLINCSLAGGAPSSDGDGSLELNIQDLRPRDTAPRSASGRACHPEGVLNILSTSPQKSSKGRSGSLSLHRSTLLPSSPVQMGHLRSPTKALRQVDSPRLVDRSLSGASLDASRYPITTSSSKPHVATKGQLRSLPRSHSHGFSTSDFSKSSQPRPKRTFPASSSANTLAWLGEEAEHMFDAEVSTVLPVSPQKSAHLLRDDEMISRETLPEEAALQLSVSSPGSAQLTTLSHTTEDAFFIQSCHQAKRSPRSHLATNEGNLTLDVVDMIEKVSKPKRASGTEESFVDLLHGEHMLDAMDMTVLGPDDSILPINTYHVSTNTRDVDTRQPPHPRRVLATIPASSIDTPTRAQYSACGNSISRSKSLSKVAEIIQRVKADRLAQPSDQEIESSTSPTKTTSGPICGPPARNPMQPNSGTSLAPRTTGSRRISLSAGAKAISAPASQKSIHLPTSLSSHVRSLSLQTRPGGLASSPIPSGQAKAAHGPPIKSNDYLLGSDRITPSRLSQRNRPARSEFKSHIGFSSSAVASSARDSRLPTSNRAPAVSSRATIETAKHKPRPNEVDLTSRFSKPAVPGSSLDKLPLPGIGPSARSATSLSSRPLRSAMPRSFATDATSTMNRQTRPSTSIVAGPSNKLSMGPPLAHTSIAFTNKARALSTPASAIPRQSTLPAARAAHLTGESERFRSKTLLPKMSNSLLPQRSDSKLSARPDGLAALRSRLDQLQAKQQGRGGKQR